MSKTINITPNWQAVAGIVIMVLKNPKQSPDGLKDAFDTITEMGEKLDLANKQIAKLKGAK
jgi:hypothetical protein